MVSKNPIYQEIDPIIKDIVDTKLFDAGIPSIRKGEATKQSEIITDRISNFRDQQQGIGQEVMRKVRKGGSPQWWRKKLGFEGASLGKKLGRNLGSVLTINPEVIGDLTEKLLSLDLTDKQLHQAYRRFQDFSENAGEALTVGHHGVSLSLLRDSLKNLPPKIRNTVLDIFEQDYGYKFAEEGMEFLSPFAHEMSGLGSYDKSMRIKDMAPAFGVQNLDDLNPNLREILRSIQAHSPQFGGTKGFADLATEAVKGKTTPKQIVKALQPLIEGEMQGTRQGIETTKAIFTEGFKDGKVNLDAWKQGGKVEKALRNIKKFEPPSIFKNPVVKGIGRTALGLLDPLKAVAGAHETMTAEDDLERFTGQLSTISGLSGTAALGFPVTAPVTGPVSFVTGLAEEALRHRKHRNIKRQEYIDSYANPKGPTQKVDADGNLIIPTITKTKKRSSSYLLGEGMDDLVTQNQVDLAASGF